MDSTNLNVVCWNVRGLNMGGHHSTVRESVVTAQTDIICLQETKIEAFSLTWFGNVLALHLMISVSCPLMGHMVGSWCLGLLESECGLALGWGILGMGQVVIWRLFRLLNHMGVRSTGGE